jgi:hypothetical protein
MKHVTFQSHQYILSRERGSVMELVDCKTGRLVLVCYPLEPGISPPSLPVLQEPQPDVKAVLFPFRPPEFLTQLRQRREEYLKAARAGKVRSRKVEKSPAKPGERKPRGSRAAKAGSKAQTQMAAAVSNLPPEVQAMLRAQGVIK